MFRNSKLFAAVLAVCLVLAGTARGGDRAAGSADGAGGGVVQLPKGMRQEAIHDPATNMDAFFVFIPTDWRFQATVLQGTRCSADPFPVLRASSPDGLTQAERLPRFDWKWGDAPWLPKGTPPGCLPLTELLSASEFLKRLSAVSQVEYVGEVPIPADKLEAQKKSVEQFNAMTAQTAAHFNSIPPIQHGDMAQAKVRYQNGGAPMEALLFVNLVCFHNSPRGLKQQIFSVNVCSATVRVVRSPAGKLDDAVRRLELAGERPNQRWVQARMDLQARQDQAMANQMQNNFNQQMALQNQQFQQSQALQQQRHEQFQQSQAQQQQIHEQSLSTMQRGTDMSMQRAQQNANARSTAASDTVDYALGQQTVRDPNTGQLSKVSAGYNHTWVNDTGKVSYQTDNSNANPNGYVQGNWTQQQQVHGDGTSK
jgi:hypothetical protein